MLELDAQLADALLGLDEGAPHVVVADDAELEGNAALLGIADGRGNAGVGDRDDHVGARGGLAGELGAHLLAQIIDVAPGHDRVGPGEVDVLEDAGARRASGEGTVAFDAVGRDGHDLAVLDLAHELGADDVERAGLRCQHIGAVQASQHQRPDADGVAGADQHVVGQADERIGALDLPQGLDEALHGAAALRAGHQVQDHLAVGGRLADGARGDEVAPQGERVRQVAVVGEGDAARVEIGE